MPIPFYACRAEGPNIITLDDEAVQTDLAAENGTGGNAYIAFVTSTIFDVVDGGYSTFRRAVQHVHADGAVTVKITPFRDENETGNTITRTLAIGANPIVTAPIAESGTNFQVKVALSSFSAAAELGKALQYVVPRRTAR